MVHFDSKFLKRGKKYLQIAFNADLSTVNHILPQIPKNERIIIEAGTPFIKNFGVSGIRHIVYSWGGYVLADMKTVDGALGEVQEVLQSGANAATVAGSAPKETIEIFIKACRDAGIDSFIDMIGVEEPLKSMRRLREQPTGVVLHKGRDEENVFGKVIQYKHISKIRSKFDVFIVAAGGIDHREASSALFNGADIVVVNVVRPEDPWKGIKTTEQVNKIVQEFLSLLK